MACGASSIASIGVWYVSNGQHAPPRSIIVLCFVLDTAAIGKHTSYFLRLLRERQRGSRENDRPLRRIVIVGAGDVGANLAKEMKLRRDLRMDPIAFFDDDAGKWNTHVARCCPCIMDALRCWREGRFPELMKLIIAMAESASGRRVREVVQIFNRVHLKFETVPSMEQMVDGVVKASQIRPVQIEDLLGRERISIEAQRILESVQRKVVLVTGAGGSIGSELCRQIAAFHPSKLLLVERCEVQIFQIEQELLGMGYKAHPSCRWLPIF